MAKLNDTLNSIFVRLDVSMQNLSSKALAQLIVKILYAHDRRMNKNEIKEELAKVNGGKRIGDQEVNDLLESLSQHEIKYDEGKYYLSQPKRSKINESIIKAEERNENILNRFFTRLETPKDIIKEWLNDATIKFFEVYSEEWISDLKASTNFVASNGESIKNLIENRTESNKKINKDYKKVLPKLFFDFVNTSDGDVDDYLWEYGTSAFASKLIRTMHGVDTYTIDTFRNSHCILDTNILMFIALESRYKDAFKSIEKVFNDLGVKVSILYITKHEYENRVANQKRITLHNLDKFGYDITTLPNDDFTAYAKSLNCKTVEDFEIFFDQTLKIPEFINETVSIKVLDNKSINSAVEKAQEDDGLKTELNNLFKTFAKHDKFEAALKHDIGLIEAVRFLRNDEFTRNEKYFIISEEISINQYSKKCGFVNDLPLCLRVDTLINLLAVNNGGDTFDSTDYTPLFANIIRLGLTPSKDTFRQTELYQYYKMNSKIADLPSDTTKEIVEEMHKKMMDGEDDNDLLRDLNELVTDGEIKAKKELEQTKDELHITTKDRDNEREKRKRAETKLREEIKKTVTKEYDDDTKRLKFKYWLTIPIILMVLAVIAFCVMNYNDSITTGVSLLLSFPIGVIASLVVALYGDNKYINTRKRNRDVEINRITDERLLKN